MKRGRIRPGRGVSFFGMVVGLIMIGFGITYAIPDSGAFGVIWTMILVGVTAYNAYNAFSARGIAMQEIDIEDSSDSHDAQNDMADRLKRLKKLRMDGLITEEEYRKKR